MMYDQLMLVTCGYWSDTNYLLEPETLEVLCCVAVQFVQKAFIKKRNLAQIENHQNWGQFN